MVSAHFFDGEWVVEVTTKPVGSDEYVSRCNLKGNNEHALGSYPTSICAVVIIVVGAEMLFRGCRTVVVLSSNVEGQGSSRGFGLSKFEARAVSPTKLSERLGLGSAF